jgi:flagellar hook-associated protein 3 FlgL
LLAQAQLLQQLHGDQIDIQRLTQQISTGRRITNPSEDAPAAQRGQTLQRLLELKAQSARNIQTSQSYLDASDDVLAGIAKLLSDVRATALEAVSDTSSAAQRQTAAEEVALAIEQLVTAGNQNFRGRYLFGGSRTNGPPFIYDGTRIVYQGDEGALESFVDVNLAYATNATGAEVFGAYSAEVRGAVDLNPALTPDTPLADLFGGRGVSLGSVVLGDGTNKSTVDLSSAATIGDVAELLAANPPAGRTITATVTATGLTIDIDDAGGGNLSIKEVPDGNTAQQLRIHSPLGSGVSPVVGGDLNPRLRLTTRLADLQSAGPPFDFASGVQITNAGQTYAIDTSTATTIEDLLNAFNGSPANVLAQIDESGERLLIRSRLSGADFSIGENGGTTAAQLGIRSLTADTTLASLNHGRGVSERTGTDFSIVRKDGVQLDIDIAGAATVGDIIDLINNHPGNLAPGTQVVARLAAGGNGIELFDGNVAGAGTLQVLRTFGSNAAWDLGLVPVHSQSATATTSALGDTLTASDANPLEVSGAFNSLLRLHDALENFDRGGIERAIALLDEDFDRVNFARGEIGSRGRTLESIQSHLEDEEILLKANLADEIEVDLTQAISDLAARQAAYQASLNLAANLFQLSLFNFL